jgi:membrane-bound lytic murein transglycosylase A
MRPLAILLAGFLVLAGLLYLMAGYPFLRKAGPAPLALTPTRFEQLEGWAADDHVAALETFLRSCIVLEAAPPQTEMGPYGTVEAWLYTCAAAHNMGRSERLARIFFETAFVPFSVRAGAETEGLFTGYYEPELKGSRRQSARYSVPLLARPADLVSVDLGKFRDTLNGERIAGRVENGKLLPYADRKELEAQALTDNDPMRHAIVFVDDPVDAFFLHIQGSGRVRLDDGSVIRLGYDGQNGHPYTPIGRLIAERAGIDPKAVTMQSIRAWLAAHPVEAPALMDANASYVFFSELPVGDPALGPPGAEGVALTPGRSLAVDLSVHALGVPVYLETSLPASGAQAATLPFRQLMVAQDTGGAIRGAVRGDIFFGFGAAAAMLAGAMNEHGRMTILLPHPVAARFEAAAHGKSP